jgi:hypothetical protein
MLAYFRYPAAAYVVGLQCYANVDSSSRRAPSRSGLPAGGWHAGLLMLIGRLRSDPILARPIGPLATASIRSSVGARRMPVARKDGQPRPWRG